MSLRIPLLVLAIAFVPVSHTLAADPDQKARKKPAAQSPASKQSLNPQPLPPRDGDRAKSKAAARADAASLNPQPLPPKTAFILSDGRSARVVGKNLIIVGGLGESKARPGRYPTRDGRVIVVNAKSQIEQ